MNVVNGVIGWLTDPAQWSGPDGIPVPPPPPVDHPNHGDEPRGDLRQWQTIKLTNNSEFSALESALQDALQSQRKVEVQWRVIE